MKHGYFYQFKDDEIDDLLELGHYGFEFDWTIKKDTDALTVGYVYEGKVLAMVEYIPVEHEQYNEIALLEVSQQYRNMRLGGKMIAYVAQNSKKRGYSGVMLVISKTALRKFYIEKLGGIQIGSTNRIYFTEEAAEKIIKNYGGDDL